MTDLQHKDQEVRKVEIYLDTFRYRNNILVDGIGVLSTSRLDAFLHEPLFNWKENIYDAIDRDINDDFTLTVISPAFEFELLKALGKGKRYCLSIEHKDPALGQSLDERISILKQIAQTAQLALPKRTIEENLYFSDDVDATWVIDSLQGHPGITIEGNDRMAVNLHGLLEIQCRMMIGGTHVSDSSKIKEIYLSDHIDLAGQGRITSIGLPKERFAETLLAYLAATVGNAEFIAALDSCSLPNLRDLKSTSSEILHQQKNSGLTEEDFQHYILLDRLQPIYFIQNAPTTIRKGKTIPLVGGSFPSGFYPALINPRISNPSVLRWTPVNKDHVFGEFLALNEGETDYQFWLAERPTPAFEGRVKCIDPNYAKQLQLPVHEVVIEKGKSWTPELQVIPPDAEDIDYLKWSSTDTSIASVTAQGTVFGKKSGQTMITVQGEDTQASFRVAVKDPISTLAMAQDSYQARVGQRIPIIVKAMPNDCFDNRYTIESSNKTVVVIPPDGTPQAVGIGECTITCTAVANSDITTTCKVIVLPVKSKQEDHLRTFFMIAALWFLTCFLPFIPALLFIAEFFYGFKAVGKLRSNMLPVAGILLIQAILVLIFKL